MHVRSGELLVSTVLCRKYAARIVVLSGPRAGAEIAVPSDGLPVGRDENAVLSISDPLLSRRHFAITFEEGSDQIEDLGSHNGTRLNGAKVKGKRTLRHGDRIEAGETELVFLTREEEADAESRVYIDDTAFTPPETIVVERAHIRLSKLLDVIGALRSSRDRRSVGERVLSTIFQLTPAERAAVLLSDFRGEFEPAAGRDRREPARSIRVSRSIVQRVLKDVAAILSNDLRGSGIDSIESLKTAKIKALVCVPMEAFGRCLGAIYADCSDPDARFEKDHLELLTAVATVATVAFENASTIEDLENKNSILQDSLHIQSDLLGNSPAIREIRKFIARIAPTTSTVLIEGESGTGKELLARAIHDNSERRERPFVAINCGALPEALVESELFGHEKGSFTGAVAQKKGRIEIASGGTVFLDEVGELALPIQVKLLRVLQEEEIDRLGGTRPIKVDIRVIAATNRDLKLAIANGGFREDLYYRLKVLPITIPPLRERREDILNLAEHFVSKYRKKFGRGPRSISPETAPLLESYGWPGNVRELENMMERAVVLGLSGTVLPEDLHPDLFEGSGDDETVERDKVIKAFFDANGDYRKAAAILKRHPNGMHRLLKRLGLGYLLKPKP